MEITLEGRVAIVTGGGSGLGLGYAQALAEAGAAVAVWSTAVSGPTCRGTTCAFSIGAVCSSTIV